jgi:hypothetical protein
MLMTTISNGVDPPLPAAWVTSRAKNSTSPVCRVPAGCCWPLSISTSPRLIQTASMEFGWV